MNIKLKAAAQTAALIASAVTISVVVSLVANYYPTVLLYLGGAMIAGVLVYLIYGLMLSRLQYYNTIETEMDKIKEITKKY